jgi:hypothetical protein
MIEYTPMLNVIQIGENNTIIKISVRYRSILFDILGLFMLVLHRDLDSGAFLELVVQRNFGSGGFFQKRE